MEHHVTKYTVCGIWICSKCLLIYPAGVIACLDDEYLALSFRRHLSAQRVPFTSSSHLVLPLTRLRHIQTPYHSDTATYCRYGRRAHPDNQSEIVIFVATQMARFINSSSAKVIRKDSAKNIYRCWEKLSKTN